MTQLTPRSHGLVCASCCRSLLSDSHNPGIRLTDFKIVVSDVQKFDFVVEGAERIARCISRFAIFENVYLHPSHTTTESSKALEEAMTRLYASIFVYLARAKQYYEQSTASASSHHPGANLRSNILHRTRPESYCQAPRGVRKTFTGH